MTRNSIAARPILEERHDSAAELASTLAASIARRLDNALHTRGSALIALSGGRSPIGVFRQLRNYPLDWGRVTIAQVDERWVEQEHVDSNARLIREHLLCDKATAATLVVMKNAAPTPHLGAAECNQVLVSLARPFDIVLLGMGEDGHIASLFPGAPELAYALSTHNLCSAVTPPSAPHLRMSLSLSGLLNARTIALLVTGSAKLAIYDEAQRGGSPEDLPVRAILQQHRAPVEVWLGAGCASAR